MGDLTLLLHAFPFVFLVCVCNGTAGGFSGRFITKFDSFWPVSAVCTHIVRGYKRAAAIGDAGTRQVGGRNINLAISCCLRVNISTRWSVRKKILSRVPSVGPVQSVQFISTRLAIHFVNWWCGVMKSLKKWKHYVEIMSFTWEIQTIASDTQRTWETNKRRQKRKNPKNSTDLFHFIREIKKKWKKWSASKSHRLHNNNNKK